MIQKEINDPKGKINKEGKEILLKLLNILALNLALQLLEVDPNKRPTAAQALEHPFLSNGQTKNKIDTIETVDSPLFKPTQYKNLLYYQ